MIILKAVGIAILIIIALADIFTLARINEFVEYFREQNPESSNMTDEEIKAMTYLTLGIISVFFGVIALLLIILL